MVISEIISSVWYLTVGVVKIPLGRCVYDVPVQDKCFICVTVPSFFFKFVGCII